MSKLLIIIGFFLSLSLSQASAQTLIVNKATHVNQLDQRTVKSIFFQRIRNWPNGIPVTIVAFERTTQLHENFSKDILNVLPFRLESTWSKLAFTGVSKPVVRVTSVVEMLDLVNSTPGAIGYIEENTVVSNPNIVLITLGESS